MYWYISITYIFLHTYIYIGFIYMCVYIYFSACICAQKDAYENVHRCTIHSISKLATI